MLTPEQVAAYRERGYVATTEPLLSDAEVEELRRALDEVIRGESPATRLLLASDGSVWLFSSSEAVHNLQASLPDVGWSRARAVTTHERIAQAARAAGFAEVRETRPALADVRASIESFA